MKTRMAIAIPGIALLLFGVFRLVTQVPFGNLVWLAVWLGAAVILHDGVLSPLTIGVSALLARHVPPRGRTFIQGALIAGALVTVIAVPMIYLRNSQPKVKAILDQNFAVNLAILLAIITAGAAVLYLIRVRRGRHAASATNVRPDADHSPTTE